MNVLVEFLCFFQFTIRLCSFCNGCVMLLDNRTILLWLDRFFRFNITVKFFLLFMITFGFAGFGMLIGSFKMISGGGQETSVEGNIETPIIDPIVDNEWWKS